MIRSFRCKETERVWQGYSTRKFPGDIQDRAMRKLRQLDAAATIEDLRNPTRKSARSIERKTGGADEH
jgi:proteic killer suppression protein